MFPSEYLDDLWATKGEDVGLVRAIIVSKISNLCDPDPPTLQKDGLTTCNLNTARMHYGAVTSL